AVVGLNIANTGNKGRRLRSCRSDANYARFISNSLVSNIDVVAPSGEVFTGIKAQCDVAVADGVVFECKNADGGVLAAGVIAKERRNAVCGVCVATGVVNERIKAIGRVVTAGAATEHKTTIERKSAGSGIVNTGRVS